MSSPSKFFNIFKSGSSHTEHGNVVAPVPSDQAPKDNSNAQIKDNNKKIKKDNQPTEVELAARVDYFLYKR